MIQSTIRPNGARHTDTIREILDDRRVGKIQAAGVHVLRYGLTFLLVLFGAMKFAAFEVEGIKPLVANSPLLSWLYGLFSPSVVSAMFGVFEITTGVLIATRRWWPTLSGLAGLAAAGMFAITLSFLFTTPGVMAPTSDAGGFLMKDIMLLGAALFTGAEALFAARSSQTIRV